MESRHDGGAVEVAVSRLAFTFSMQRRYIPNSPAARAAHAIPKVRHGAGDALARLMRADGNKMERSAS